MECGIADSFYRIGKRNRLERRAFIESFCADFGYRFRQIDRFQRAAGRKSLFLHLGYSALYRNTAKPLALKECALADFGYCRRDSKVFQGIVLVKDITAYTRDSVAEYNVCIVYSCPRHSGTSVLVLIGIIVGDIAAAAEGQSLCYIVKAPCNLRAFDCLSGSRRQGHKSRTANRQHQT